MNKMHHLLALNAIILCISIQFIVCARRECLPRDYGKGSIICVCNATYCDDLNAFTTKGKGVISLFETSKRGARMKESELTFGKQYEVNAGATKKQTISIDRSKTFQKIIGFGGAFTDSAGIVIRTLSTALQNNIIADYYSNRGIEYTLGRIPIGGCDFSTRPYSYDEVVNDDDLIHFNLTNEDHYYKIPFLKLAKSLSPHTVRYYGSPWSPPAWMKNNNKLYNGGYLIGKPGEKYYKMFANYFVKFLDAYKYNAIDIWGITIENEPGAGNDPTWKWNSLGFTPEIQRDFIKLDLGPTLAKAGYGTNVLKVMINDDQRPTLLKWADTIFADKDAAKYVAGTAFHWYMSNDGNIEQLDKTHNAWPDFWILGTEACEEWVNHTEKVSLGNWATFDRYSYDIITDLNHWVTGWTDWNLALDLEGGPNWVQNFVDAPIIVNATSNEYYKQPFFYALGHFSKFLLPDSVRVNSTVSPKIEKFDTTVFVRPDGNAVLIALNRNSEDVILTIDDGSTGKLTYTVPPNSIQTYIWH